MNAEAAKTLRSVPVLGGPNSAAAAVRRDVVGVLRNHGMLKLSDIAGRTKWQTSRIRIALENMQTEGIVRLTPSGKWTLVVQELSDMPRKIELLKELAKNTGDVNVIRDVAEIVSDLERLGGGR